MLITHGTADNEDLPARTQTFYDEAVAAGIRAELHFCEGRPQRPGRHAGACLQRRVRGLGSGLLYPNPRLRLPQRSFRPGGARSARRE